MTLVAVELAELLANGSEVQIQSLEAGLRGTAVETE